MPPFRLSRPKTKKSRKCVEAQEDPLETFWGFWGLGSLWRLLWMGIVIEIIGITAATSSLQHRHDHHDRQSPLLLSDTQLFWYVIFKAIFYIHLIQFLRKKGFCARNYASNSYFWLKSSESLFVSNNLYMGKMGSICQDPRALPASIWGHCSQVLVFTSIWGAHKKGCDDDIFVLLFLASGYFGTPKHCRTREKTKWQISTLLYPPS